MDKRTIFGNFFLKTVIVIPVLFASLSFAVTPRERLEDPVLEQRARNLSEKLRCLVCQNQSIDDSEAPLARDLRLLLRNRLVAGDDDDQIIDYIVSRYGEFVLLRPRLGRHTFLLWFSPVIFVLSGGMAIFFSFKKRGRIPNDKLTGDECTRIKKLVNEKSGS